MSTTIPNFAQDTMDTQEEPTVSTITRDANPTMPNIARVLQTSPYGKSALWVSELRRRLALTQPQLGQAIGCSAATVGSWERGQSQPASPEHRKALQRAGQSRLMPDLPPLIGNARNYFGPRVDPDVERLFAEHFGDGS